MESLSGELKREFERWCQQVHDEKPLGKYCVTARQVLRAHFALAQHFEALREGMGGVGPRSVHLLQSAIARQDVGFGRDRKWTSLFDVTATLFFGLVKNHAFHDANKRTALLTAIWQLRAYKRVITARQRELEELTVRVAEDKLGKYSAFGRFREEDDPEVSFISWYFQRNTREVDNRVYVVTARQLDGLLRQHGFWLADPSGNHIDVMTEREETIFFRKRRTQRRVAQIGFRDWGTEVARHSVEDLRKKLKLTSEYGVDSAVFYQGIDSLESLIAEYSGPLQRLADK